MVEDAYVARKHKCLQLYSSLLRWRIYLANCKSLRKCLNQSNNKVYGSLQNYQEITGTRTLLIKENILKLRKFHPYGFLFNSIFVTFMN